MATTTIEPLLLPHRIMNAVVFTVMKSSRCCFWMALLLAWFAWGVCSLRPI